MTTEECFQRQLDKHPEDSKPALCSRTGCRTGATSERRGTGRWDYASVGPINFLTSGVG
jgi:hypothetical protein